MERPGPTAISAICPWSPTTSFTIYSGLQTQVTMRNYHGLTGNINYTFSHVIDNTSEIYGTGAGGTMVAVSQNPLDPNFAERGTSGFSFPPKRRPGAPLLR